MLSTVCLGCPRFVKFDAHMALFRPKFDIPATRIKTWTWHEENSMRFKIRNIEMTFCLLFIYCQWKYQLNSIKRKGAAL